ncbi:MAG TPA: GAF domain-containing sensor histidine kinase [Actinomycetota bacterium]
MSGRSVSLRSEGRATPARTVGGRKAESDRWLERLTGVGSSKPTFYAEWRRKSQELDRAVEALNAISTALGTTTRGPQVLCRAVLEAVGRRFGASCAAIVFTGRHMLAERPPQIIVWPEAESAPEEPGGLPFGLREVADRAATGLGPAVGGGRRAGGIRLPARVGVPLRTGGDLLGTLVMCLPESPLDENDLAVLDALANQVAVAIENACLYEESEQLRARFTAAWEEANRQARELEKRNRQLQRARQRLLEGRQHQLISQERNRIARELHDTVAQYLVSIGMNLEWCRRHEPSSSAVNERVSISKELARSALAHIRGTIFELGSLDKARPGFVLALQDLAEEFRATARLDVRVRIRGGPCPLPLSTEHALFRIAQEAMWNVAKHAGASRAWINLDLGGDTLQLSVSDDGTGDAGAIRRHLERAGSLRRSGYHRGLANIRERVHELHGTVRVTRYRGGGVRLTVTAPVERAGTDARA